MKIGMVQHLLEFRCIKAKFQRTTHKLTKLINIIYAHVLIIIVITIIMNYLWHYNGNL